MGMYVGAPCENRCSAKLHHVKCDQSTKLCVCEKKYPVMIGLIKGCAKRKLQFKLSFNTLELISFNFHHCVSAKKLGEQCFYDQTCIHNDIYSLCIQVRHNALCQCISGFHSVTYSKPTKRVFCTEGELN